MNAAQQLLRLLELERAAIGRLDGAALEQLSEQKITLVLLMRGEGSTELFAEIRAAAEANQALMQDAAAALGGIDEREQVTTYDVRARRVRTRQRFARVDV